MLRLPLAGFVPAVLLCALAPAALGQRTYTVDIDSADAAFDHARGHLYLSSRAHRQLVEVELASGVVTNRWALPYPAESIAITPNGHWLYVALLSQPHDYYDFDDHEGYIGEVDLSTGELTRTFRINEDPWDIVATDSGFLVVSSGSGQWDEIRSYDLDTEVNVGTSFIRNRCYLALHPSQMRIYAANTDLSPSDIERFDLNPVTGALTAQGDSPYHGDHPMDGNVFVHPNGQYLITRGGGVYTSTLDRTTDMRFVRTLDFGFFDSVAFDVPFQGLLTAGASTIDYYNLATLESVERIPLGTGPDHLSVSGSSLYAVEDLGGQTRVTVMVSPSSFSAGNTPPVAAFTIPLEPLKPGQPIKFDAASSSDAQDRLSNLLFRWDFSGDGVFDTPFTGDSLAFRSYAVAGTKTVTLEVKDSFGLVGRATRGVDVRIQQASPGTLVPRPLFEVQFKAADVAFDALRPYVYASSLEQRKVVRVNRWTGLQNREWTFPYPAESLAITPDGRRLFVALLSYGHQYYGFDDHEGYIGEIDLSTGELTRTFRINEDPWDIVVTDSGFLVVSSGAGQWDEIRSYDLDTEVNVGTSFIRHRSYLALHPSQTRIYAANTDVSPSDIERFDLDPSTGTLTARGDSPYHGDHPMGGNVFAHPNGQYLITRDGGVYTSTLDRATDMRYVLTLSSLADCLAFSPDASHFATAYRDYYFDPDTTLTLHDANTFQPVHEITLPGGVKFLRFERSRILAVSPDEENSLFIEVRLVNAQRP